MVVCRYIPGNSRVRYGTRQGQAEQLAEVDEEIGELFPNDELFNNHQIAAAIRRSTIALKFSPVFLGFAIKNTAVQPSLTKEDPTFKVHIDHESKETIISGMGELHLEIYVERMRREYNTNRVTGKPRVAFRETITQRADFAYTHKKQTGGAGQYAKVVGYIEPMEPDPETGKDVAFESVVMGGNIPTNFIPAIEKGFYEALEKGALSGNAIFGCHFVLKDGAFHAVDSSKLAFRLATIGAFLVAPVEFQSQVIGRLNTRRGTIVDGEVRDDEFTAAAEVALNDMFGHSNQLRGSTQGKGEFSMEYKHHMPVLPNLQKDLEEAYRKTLVVKK
ncbi:uncharacterized protein LACBIDRAFT_309922 [Laccaria bicolor S238N-H82]|uniref:Predicted protein n=1 Tax=Laccaria bicolor (strain S238N-H82 / ATCC MYA-4686) TaxID=486041 RepID=B0DTC8_LACBS|nr:uncharacterized protein LACBIDRAFT_309922 [Laccaria bicolor S238N-H82]EDR02252.1 predicted protein [Laccaria bicolor S238N-H82]|eukprot:XP_001887197.1 predicted protein [Laccaria bicolor S238N-H82]